LRTPELSPNLCRAFINQIKQKSFKNQSPRIVAERAGMIKPSD